MRVLSPIMQIQNNQMMASRNYLINSLSSLTGYSNHQSERQLNQSDWNITKAIDNFFSQNYTHQSKFNSVPNELKQLYLNLTNETEQSDCREMNDGNLEMFARDVLRVRGDSVLIGHIVLNVMGIVDFNNVKMEHFINLCDQVRCYNPSQLHLHLERLGNELLNGAIYKQLYLKLYKCYTNTIRSTSLDLQTATHLWSIYLKPSMHLYRQFMQYLSQRTKIQLRIHYDLWNMVYEFGITVKNLQDYKETDGWPVFIDQFVDFMALTSSL